MIVELNGVVTDDLSASSFKRYPKLIAHLILGFLNTHFSDRILSVSKSIKESYLGTYGNKYHNKIKVVENGVDVEMFRIFDKNTTKSELGLDRDRRYVLFIGNLAPWLDFDILLLSAKKLKDAGEHRICFILGGDGRERSRLEKKIREFEIADNFVLLGAVDHQEVSQYISCAEVCLATYVPHKKGSSMKVKEYLACGATVLGTDFEDLKWMAEKDLLVTYQAGDHDDFHDKLRDLLSTNSKLQGQLVSPDQRRQFIVENHSWDHVAREITQMING